MTTDLVELPTEITRAFGADLAESSRNIALQLAIDMYWKGGWSTGKCAESAGMGLIAFMDLLRDRKIESPYTEKMLEQDFKYGLGGQ